MNTQDKYVTRELAEKLKAAGVVQESEYCWYTLLQVAESNPRRTRIDVNFGTPDSEWAEYSAAFDCAELLEMLPKDSFVRKICGVSGDEFMADITGFRNITANTPAEALGKLYLWCLENGHVERKNNDKERKTNSK